MTLILVAMITILSAALLIFYKNRKIKLKGEPVVNKFISSFHNMTGMQVHFLEINPKLNVKPNLYNILYNIYYGDFLLQNVKV